MISALPLGAWAPIPTAAQLIAPLARLLQPLALRIDVDHPAADIERELDTLYARMHRLGTPLHGMDTDDGALPGFRLHTRTADGELYVYVEDVAARRLAGYTVFNRLIEVDRRADRHLRAPHSKYAPAYQRRGLATAVYRHALDGGLCLISGARQSAGAHALWHALAARYASGYVDVRDKRLTYLGEQVDRDVRDSLHTRRILLGAKWTLVRLANATGMQAHLPA